jgi:tetratricopeptide (TPR) repeat protein
MTAVTALKDLTAAAIREAMLAAGAGRIREAIAVGERALAAGGDETALNAMIGTLHCRSGNLDAGVRHLAAAHADRPDDAVVATNLVTALAQLGRNREALDLISDELVRNDPSLQLLRARAFLAQQIEEFDSAVKDYEQVVTAAPDDWESWNNLGNARRETGDFDGAVEALRRSVEINPEAAPSRFNYATALENAGKWDEAERELRAMARDFPADEKPLRQLFTLLKRQSRDEEALEAIDEAARRAPGDLELVLGLASHSLTQQRHALSEEAYRRAIAIDPKNVLGFLGIATVLDQTNRTEELAEFVEEAEEAELAPEGLCFVKAFDHRRAKRYAEGLEALSQVPNELETARRQQLLGQLLEGVGRYDEAIEAFQRMNAIIADDPSDPIARAATYRDEVRQNREELTDDWVNSWSHVEIDERPSPAFLMGFPRSGTTLLDTILMGHPGIEVLEEEPTLMSAMVALVGFDAIPGATADQVKAARDAYFKTARSRTPLEPGKLLVDKNPLATNNLPIIRRLFPDARIILALRHPCDVVLSCYITNFKPNNAMASFLQLDTAAELYDLTFSYFEKARELLQPTVHTIVYENIVADRDRELRPLLDFLGLEWNDRVLDHESTARGRAHIKTASYAQVVEPIYTRSAGRWLNYRKHLEPVLPVLRPWVEKFGYEL